MRPLRHRFYTYRSANRHLLRETVYMDMQTTEEKNMEMNDYENALDVAGKYLKLYPDDNTMKKEFTSTFKTIQDNFSKYWQP